MQIQFKTKNPKQLEAVKFWTDDTTEQLLYGGAKGGGKSYLGCSLIFGDALMYPGTNYYIARKELNDLRKYTIPSVHEVFRHWELDIDAYAPFNGQDNVFNLHNGSKVYLIACKEEPSDPFFERFGSMQMTRGWLEEAGEIAEAAKSNLWLATGRWRNAEYGLKKKQLITANPKKGWMKREFIDPFRENKLSPEKQVIQAYATDNKYLDPDYIKTLSEEKDVVRRQRLFEGNWDYDETKDSLISEDALTDAFTNTIIKDNNKYMTVDVARLGRDFTVFSFWDGLELYRIERFGRQDTEKTKQQAKDFAAKESIPYSHILIDEDGIGGSVVDGMFGVKGFVANSSALPTANQIREKVRKLENEFVPKTNFSNLKAQCGFKLAELINEHKIAFRNEIYRDMILEELSALLRQRDVDSDGKLKLRDKEDVKREIGRSPDIGDTIIYRAWFEIKKDALDDRPLAEAQAKQKSQFNRRSKGQVMNSTK